MLIRQTQRSLQDLFDLTVTVQEQGHETVCFLCVKPNHLESACTSGNAYLYNEGTVYECTCSSQVSQSNYLNPVSVS